MQPRASLLVLMF